MLLNAHACQPRLRLAAIAQKGRLVAGHQNWLGLALQPLHDELLGLRVHAAAAPSAAKDPWAASGSGAGNAQDSRCGFCDDKSQGRFMWSQMGLSRLYQTRKFLCMSAGWQSLCS